MLGKLVNICRHRFSHADIHENIWQMPNVQWQLFRNNNNNNKNKNKKKEALQRDMMSICVTSEWEDNRGSNLLSPFFVPYCFIAVVDLSVSFPHDSLQLPFPSLCEYLLQGII